MANEKKQNYSLINIDIQQAFDSVNHEFMFDTLEHIGFNGNIFRWIKNMYTGIKSKLYINNKLSEEIDIKQSIRQGCASSMLLFVICMEPLLRTIMNDEKITGFKQDNEAIKYIAHADDVTFICENIKSAEKLLKHIKEFSEASNLHLNKKKTKILNIGKKPIIIPKFENVKKMKILGNWTSNKGFTQNNIHDTVDKIINEINYWDRNNISMYGKTIIANTLLCSKIWYNVQIMDLEDFNIQELNDIIFKFIWANKRELVKRNKVREPFSKGGLNVINIENKIKAFKIQHVIRNITNKNNLANELYDNGKSEFYKNAKKYFEEFKLIVKNINFSKNYSVKYIYEKINISSNKEEIKNVNLIKSPLIDGKKKILNWKILNNGLPIGERWGNKSPCIFCRKNEEIDHLFVNCGYVKNILLKLCNKYKVDIEANKVHIDKNSAKILSTKEMILVSIFRHSIWIFRCLRLYEKIYFTSEELYQKIVVQINKYNKYMNIFSKTQVNI